MKILNELVGLAKEANNNPRRETIIDFELACQPAKILAIAEAFRSLSQRVEAAEAKLAELEKQEPAGYAVKRFDNGNFGSWLQSKGMAKGNADYYVVPLFERPAPSAGWEGLIPKKLPMDIPFAAHRIRNGGWNDCINAILRNIEEAK